VVYRRGLFAVWRSPDCSFWDVTFQNIVPQSCARFFWNADRFFLNTWRHIPKVYLYGYRCAITSKMADFIFLHDPLLLSRIIFLEEGAFLWVGKLLWGVDVRPCCRSGYHVSLDVWTVWCLLLSRWISRWDLIRGGLQEILDPFSLRLGESATLFPSVWIARTDILYRCTGMYSVLLVLPNTRTFITASRSPWARWTPNEHKMQGATPVRYK
jgi:hypothetical protein